MTGRNADMNRALAGLGTLVLVLLACGSAPALHPPIAVGGCPAAQLPADFNYAELPLFPIGSVALPDAPVTSWPSVYDFCGFLDTAYCSLNTVLALGLDLGDMTPAVALLACVNADLNGPLNMSATMPLMPNGIPDGQYELGILGEALNNAANPYHAQAQAVFQGNFQQTKNYIGAALVTAGYWGILPMLPDLVGSLAALMSGYAELGDPDSNAAVNTLFPLIFDIAPPAGGIESLTASVPALGPSGDADGDGYTNRAEYTYFSALPGATPATVIAAVFDAGMGLPTAVPVVVGHSLADAGTILGGAGMTVGTVTHQCSDTVAAGLVQSQSPTAGTMASSGTAVALVVSTGACNATVPNVLGQTEADANAAIATATLSTGTVTQQCSNTVAPGHVVGQTPVAGTLVTSGATVALVVSSGVCNVTVANVVGQTLPSASDMLGGAGLLITTVSQCDNNTASGRIVSQDPGAGQQVPYGSTVSLVLSIGPCIVTVPDVTGRTAAGVNDLVSSAGLVVGTADTLCSDTVAAGRVISQIPGAGQQVPRGSAVLVTYSTGLCPVPITFKDTAQTVYAYVGDQVELSVNTEGGVGTFTYEWHFERAAKTPSIVGGDTPELVLPNVTFSDAGRYWCEVTDQYATYLSPETTLEVDERLPVSGVVGVALLAGLLGAGGCSASRKRR